MYDLIREIPSQIEALQHDFLFRVALRQDNLDAWLGSLWRVIEIYYFVDVFEPLNHSCDAQPNAGLDEFATQQAHDHQGQDAIKRMYSELLVSPVMGRTEREETGILHTTECCFHMGLATVGNNDLFVGPLIPVREKDGFAQKRAIEFLPFFIAKSPSEPGDPVLAEPDLGREELLHMTSGNNGLESVLGSLQRRFFPPGDLVDVALQGSLQPVEFAPAFDDLPPQGFHLCPVKLAVVGDQDGATDSEDLFLSSVAPDCRQLVFIEPLHLVSRDAQEFPMLTGYQRSNEVEGPGVDSSQVLLGVIPFVEDERDVADILRKLPASFCQLLGHAGKHDGVVLVASVGAMKQRHVAVRGYQQGQADDTQIVTPFFAMTSLRQFCPIIETVDEGEKVCGIEEQASQIQAKVRHRRGGNLPLDLTDSQFVDAIHVVPKALTGQLGAFDPEQAGEHGLIVPFADFRLAAGCNATVDAGNQEILADRRALASLLGNMAVYKGDYLKLLGNIKGGSRSTEFADDNLFRFRVCESKSQLLRGADVFLPDDLGFAINPAALAEVVVGSSFDQFLCEARHG